MGTLNSTIEELMCCSGFCIDLLAKFGEELQFEYDLIRVTDPKWGVLKVRFFFFFWQEKWLFLVLILFFMIRVFVIGKKNKTEKSFIPIGCAINCHGLYGLYICAYRAMATFALNPRQEDNGSSGKTWGDQAVQLTRSLKIEKSLASVKPCHEHFI